MYEINKREVSGMLKDIEQVWNRMIDYEGEVFSQIKGGKFTYAVKGNSIILSRTNRSISKSVFEKALKLVPLENTVPVQGLQAPSYLYAILTDERIKCDLW